MAIRLTKAERQRFVEEAAETRRVLEAFDRARRELDSRLEEFQALYPEKWIAMYAVGDSFEHFFADTNEELLARMDELGLHGEGVVSRCLKKKTGPWAL